MAYIIGIDGGGTKTSFCLLNTAENRKHYLKTGETNFKNIGIEKTKEIIEIINPKNILFLTSSNSNLKNCSVNDITAIGSNIKTGKLGKRTIFAIPHYGSYSAYSYDNSEKTAKKLSEIFSK